MDAVSAPPAWLAGTFAGGGIALDAAIVAPERVAGLLLLAPAIVYSRLFGAEPTKPRPGYSNVASRTRR